MRRSGDDDSLPSGTGRLAGKVAVVTGAAHGIGAAIATRFVAEGALVTLADIEEKAGRALTERLGAGCRFVRCDVSKEAEVASAIRSTTTELGRLDILVNNAGLGVGAEIVDLDVDQWQRVVRVNLDGAFYGIKHAAPMMRRSGGGAILNFSSIAAGRAMPGMAAYSAAKAGVEALTRTAAAELREAGVRVNAIVPGLVQTSAAEKGSQILGHGLGMNIDQYLATKQGRWGTPDEVAAVAVHLVSNEASFTSGLLYRVDNGSG
ncbi:SDR family NAD(P)-dependent oxidoreductase [Nocardia donostiensis]|uniref:Ketoreductase domain-containing protein n=1 Tax=Nocardia donostiensis TaxID=1538463 RepID=A0A1W0B0W9_9NOCA|nr:SDR family oxidoreductase [Nocardia donostiensis]ONM48449.1 hypothetical protein B0T46_12140 [Nocardia donostiensis]OQS16162.1 hypothetical protein B0T36_05065 [Nocardia donostiensis]OQS18596.1 hypothetical protein B0T44_18555 [Nocardia donostiensis]